MIKNKIISILPLFMAVVIILQYKFVPNFRTFSVLDAGAPTNLFVYFMGGIGGVFLAWFVLAFFWQKAAEQLRKKAPLYTAALTLLLLFDIATLTTGWLPEMFVPFPDAILNAIFRDYTILQRSLFHSLLLLFSGYLIGVTAGVITGVAAGWSKRIRYWVQPVVRVLGAIPAVTWLPIILVLAHSLFQGALVLIALAVWYPVTITTMNGVMNIPAVTFEAAGTFGVSKLGMIFKVALPASSPFIFQGLTQGLSIACTALLVAEMMGVEAGLGWYINWQRGWADFAAMYGAVVIIAITFLIVNGILTIIKNRALRWKGGTL